jgi:group I intron endonuclease
MVNGKSYIGQSVNVDSRITDHFKRLMSGKHANKHLQSAFSLYGPDQFVAEIIELCSKDDLTIREQFWIDHYGFDNLYNLAPVAGSTAGMKLTKEHRQKIGKASKGRIQTKETIEKRIESRRGKKLSEETCKKISDSLKGKRKKPFSDEHRKKLSEKTKAWRARQKVRNEVFK